MGVRVTRLPASHSYHRLSVLEKKGLLGNTHNDSRSVCSLKGLFLVLWWKYLLGLRTFHGLPNIVYTVSPQIQMKLVQMVLLYAWNERKKSFSNKFFELQNGKKSSIFMSNSPRVLHHTQLEKLLKRLWNYSSLYTIRNVKSGNP